VKFNSLKYPFISVVICTYNRKKLLRECLKSVFNQDYPKSKFEVIIIDGGSTDGTEKICDEFPKVHFYVESRHGLAYARNLGAELAKGSIVAYTDDDCIVDRLWLRNLIQGFKYSDSIAGVGGPVYPLKPELIPNNIYIEAAFGLFNRGDSIRLINGFITSNCAFKKEIFDVVKFDESLGTTRRGKLILGSEDDDFCQSIIEAGYKLLYTPYAKVYHQVIPKRVRVPYIVKHAFDQGISQTRIFLKRARKMKKSRITAIRWAAAGLGINFLRTIHDRTFNSCYGLIYSASTLFFTVSCLDKAIVPSNKN